jgi:hypothetical protein
VKAATTQSGSPIAAEDPVAARASGGAGRSQPHIEAMQHFDLTDDEAAALIRELHEIVENDRYPFSPRIQTLRAILAKLRPEPVREPLPPLKVFAPPSKGRYRRRG